MSHVLPARVKAARVAAASVATAVVATGAAAATATSANAAGSVWDRVAMCESTGNWSINTGNGYYGGLQFSRSTWLGFGGGAYAPTANRATKAQQIAIAQRVLKVQGPGAWPVCSVRAGLTRANGGATSVSVSRTTTKRTAIAPRTSTTKRVAVRAASTFDQVKFIQTRLGIYSDGVVGPQTIRSIQAYVGADVDGIVGPQTVSRIERKTGLAQSGGSRLTAAHIQGLFNRLSQP